MTVRQCCRSVLLLTIGLVSVAGCEPYMSMTAQIPSQTRQAAALLPESPQFVGMFDVRGASNKIKKLKRAMVADSLRQTGGDRIRTFLDATGMEPQNDLKAVYGATKGSDGSEFSAVVFAEVTPDQIDRYLEKDSEAGRLSTYQNIPVYHLHFGGNPETNGDTISIAFVDNGTLVIASDPGRVKAAIDRREQQQGRLQDNEEYMTLVKRVGRGSTGWLVGRDVLKKALGDSSTADTVSASAPSDESSAVAQAGFQQALVEWSNRVLGLSEMSSGVSSSLDGEALGKVRQLKQQVRRQALSITLTDTVVEGELYLSMNEEKNAKSVAEMANGLIAVLRFSQSELTDRQQDLLEEAQVEQDGTLVHVRFSVARELLRQHGQGPSTAVRGVGDIRRAIPGTRPANEATRRLASINNEES